MNFVALKMLMGDRAKYLGLIFTIAFASFLLANQVSIFSNIMLRTASQIVDVPDADLWVMDRETQYFDESKALTECCAVVVRLDRITARLNPRYPATGVNLWPVAPHTVANRSQSGGRPFVISSSMR